MPGGKASLKEIVDEHLHRAGLAATMMEIEVEDRSVAGGRRTWLGAEVKGASGGFIDLVGGGRIPFHRVRKVTSKGAVVYAREPKG